MPLSERVKMETLKAQHDELKDIWDEIREVSLCFCGVGMQETADKLYAYSERIENACRKIKAVIESEEVK